MNYKNNGINDFLELTENLLVTYIESQIFVCNRYVLASPNGLLTNNHLISQGFFISWLKQSGRTIKIKGDKEN
jgi:hypothetical protein